MAITQYYVDPAIAGNSGTGTIGDPYGDLQYALDTITRNSTDGDQINIKAGTAEALAAVLSLSTYGTPTINAPLVLRGYTSAANDGGIGVISGGGGTFAILGLINYVNLIDLRLTNTAGIVYAVTLGIKCLVYRCEIDTTYAGISIGAGTAIIGCRIHKHSIYGILMTDGLAYGNYLYDDGRVPTAHIYTLAANGSAVVLNNIIATSSGAYGIWVVDEGFVIGNTIYCAGGTGSGIRNYNSQVPVAIMNNIIEGFSGAGGVAIAAGTSTKAVLVDSNAYYNNTANNTLTDAIAVGNNDVLATSAFVNAGAGDFDINGTIAGATEDAFPGSFLGLASTAPKVDKGASQAGAGSGGGGVVRRVMRILGA